MNWKTRQLFSDREHGIVSGLSPVNMVNGGSVPIPGYQTGGLALDLFEEGDQEINEPLNILAHAVSRSLDEGPTTPTETIEETVTVTEDQGSGEYQVELQELKETFKNEIRSYVSQADTTDLGKYLKNMNIAYTNELDKLKQKYSVEIEDPNDKLLTSDFIEEIMSAVNPQEITQIPEMEGGGIVESIKTKEDLAKYGIPLTIDVWLGMKPDQKKAWLYSAVAKQAAGAGATALDTTTLDNLLKDRKDIAGKIGKAARGSYSSSLPRILHYGAAKSKGELAEAEAMDKVLADQITMERALLGSGGTANRFREPADVTSAKILGVDEDLYDTSSMFTAIVKKLEAEFANYPEEQAIIEFADQGELPPYNTYRGRKLMGSIPVDWITYYNASKAQIKELPDKSTDREAYIKALLQILEDWKALPNA